MLNPAFQVIGSGARLMRALFAAPSIVPYREQHLQNTVGLPRSNMGIGLYGSRCNRQLDLHLSTGLD